MLLSVKYNSLFTENNKKKHNSKIQRDRNFVHSVDSPDRLLAKVFESPHPAAALVKWSIGQQ